MARVAMRRIAMIDMLRLMGLIGAGGRGGYDRILAREMGEFARKVVHCLRDDVNHQALALQNSAHHHQAAGEERPAIGLEYLLPHHDIGDTGFVFECRKGRAVDRPWALRDWRCGPRDGGHRALRNARERG